MVKLAIGFSQVCTKKSYNGSTFQTVNFLKITNTVFPLISAGPQISTASLTIRSETNCDAQTVTLFRNIASP